MDTVYFNILLESDSDMCCSNCAESSDTARCYIPTGFYCFVAGLGQYWGLNSGPTTPLRKNMHLASLPNAESSDAS
jgi:hypothetical protein